MTIGIDARPLIEKKSGIGVYLDRILNYILSDDNENTYVLLSDQNIFFECKSKNIQKYIYPTGRILPNTFRYEFALGRFLRKNKIELDVFWGTQQFLPFGLGRGCRKILTVHDLTFRLFPRTVDNILRIMLMLFFKPSVKRTENIICVSEYTRKMLCKYYRKICAGKKIFVIYESGNLGCGTVKTDSFSPKRDKAFLLYIGNIEPRKNIDVLLDAFESLSVDLDLIICGKKGWKSAETLERIVHNPKIKYLNYVSDAEKEYLLEQSFLFILPSKYEGFGIPVVEAMQKGTVVAVADNSSLREIVNEEKLRFQTDCSESLADLITSLYTDKERYQKMKQYCMERGNFFSWEKAAKEHLKVILETGKTGEGYQSGV